MVLQKLNEKIFYKVFCNKADPDGWLTGSNVIDLIQAYGIDSLDVYSYEEIVDRLNDYCTLTFACIEPFKEECESVWFTFIDPVIQDHAKFLSCYKKIRDDLIQMGLLEDYLNNHLSDLYIKWYLTNVGVLYTTKSFFFEGDPEIVKQGRAKRIFTINPLKDLDNLDLYTVSMDDEEFIDSVYGKELKRAFNP